MFVLAVGIPLTIALRYKSNSSGNEFLASNNNRFIYHLNFDSNAVQQLMLNFSSSVLEKTNDEEDKADDSNPQSLFGEEMF